MKPVALAWLLTVALTLPGCAGMSQTQQRTLSGGAGGAALGAVFGAIGGNAGLGGASRALTPALSQRERESSNGPPRLAAIRRSAERPDATAPPYPLAPPGRGLG